MQEIQHDIFAFSHYKNSVVHHFDSRNLRRFKCQARGKFQNENAAYKSNNVQEKLTTLKERYEIIPPTMASKPFDIYNILPSRASSYYQLPAVTQSASSYLTVNDYQQPLIRPSSYTLPSTRSYQVYPGIVSEQVNRISRPKKIP